MSRADELREKARRISQQSATSHQPAEHPAAEAPRPAPPRKVRTQRVRITTDLSPEAHRRLVGWCADAAAELGRPRVHGQEVVTALVDRLLSDPGLAAAVLDDLGARTD